MGIRREIEMDELSFEEHSSLQFERGTRIDIPRIWRMRIGIPAASTGAIESLVTDDHSPLARAKGRHITGREDRCYHQRE